MILHAATIFLGSFLLFQVQPLIGRFILPWFGGTPAVWTTCMLFFQSLLLAGYAYAHYATGFSRRRQAILHGLLLLGALLFLPVTPDPAVWKPAADARPILAILTLLGATVGVPYLLLSASAPLVQFWFIHDLPGRSPYRLYALSNAGSLLALLTYPFLIEPTLTLHRQVVLWSWGFALYACLCAYCAMRPAFNRQGNPSRTADGAGRLPGSAEGTGAPLPPRDIVLWFLLSACSSALLLATTNQLCQEVAVVPFLWIVPLALYLITFIICFRNEHGYDRTLWGLLLVAGIGFACRTVNLGMNAALSAQVLVYTATLFVGCMVCHGELVRRRPAPARLTFFYLAISAGGALGGILIGLAAPLLFTGFWEYLLSLCLTAVVVACAWFLGGQAQPAPRWLLPAAGFGLLALIGFSFKHILADAPSTLTAVRNFYGVLRVQRFRNANGDYLALMHGRVMHGCQFQDDSRRSQATSYYTAESGVGLAFRRHPNRHRPLRTGLVGLGAGTLAVYGRSGDTLRYYEINPAVIDLARSRFTFLRDSAATVETVPGDARLVLEAEAAAGACADFDLLVIDAFSSDAIPIHLLTGECFALYAQRLRADGLIAIHITNRYLDLAPLVRAEGEAAGFRVGLIASDRDAETISSRTQWIVMGRDKRFFSDEAVSKRLQPLPPPVSRLWTDDYASLWPLIKR
jgi:spermidine synthase